MAEPKDKKITDELEWGDDPTTEELVIALLHSEPATFAAGILQGHAAARIVILSRQYEELRRALVAAEKALHPMFARVFNDNHDLAVNTLSFSYDEIVAACFAYKKIKSALSSAPSPSETEKSTVPAAGIMCACGRISGCDYPSCYGQR